MENPFKYWRVVGEEDFCDRKKELAELLRIMENSGRAFVYSERRSGKTSLIKLALSKLPSKLYVPVYIDLWKTDSSETFITTTAKAYSDALSTSVEKTLDTAKTLFSHLKPALTMDEQGNPSLTFGIVRSSQVEPGLDDVLKAPEKLSAKGRRAVVVFDEFQQILTYGHDEIERKIRSVIQHQDKTGYVFLGSRKHMVREMFLKGSRPLYRSASQFPLGPIPEGEWRPFIQERFRRTKKRISPDQIHAIVAMTQGQPFYTQYLCHALWEFCEPRAEATDGLLHQALQTVLEKEQYMYMVLWESLTLNQRRFLRALASEDPPAKPFSSEFLRRHHIGSASSVQRVISTLLEKDHIEQDNGSYIVSDRFFRLWLREFQID